MKTFVPSMITDVHDLHVYLTRYGATIIAAVTVISPEAVPVVQTLIAAVAAADALRETLENILP